MPKLRIETLINAPRELCFDLIRDPRVLAVNGGVAVGPFSLGQIVTFQSRWMGIENKVRMSVTKFDRPICFVDEMAEGKLRRLFHTHEFEDIEGTTRLIDTFEWNSPFGIVGKFADAFLVESRLQRLVTKRNTRLKELAEDCHSGVRGSKLLAPQ